MQNGILRGAWGVLIRDKETQVHMRAPSISLGNSIRTCGGVLPASRVEGEGLRSASEGCRCQKIGLESSNMTSPRGSMEQLNDSYCG